MRNSIYSQAVLALTVTLASQTNFAGMSWVSNGPYYKTIKAVSISPQHPNVVFAGALGSGVFKSTDGGLSWANFKSGMTSTSVRSLLSLSDTVVFAGTNDGVYKTVD